MIVLSQRYADAVAYAAAAHASQARKGTAVPYMAHLLAVSSLVLEAGGDEDMAIAGLLHDTAEDHGGEDRLRDIEDRFGIRIADIVRACSDSLEEEGDDKDDWETRKRGHLARLATASDDALVVWAADKVHNSRAIVTDLLVHGQRAMDRFHGTADQVIWYYRENLGLLEARGVARELVFPLQASVGRMAELIGG